MTVTLPAKRTRHIFKKKISNFANTFTFHNFASKEKEKKRNVGGPSARGKRQVHGQHIRTSE
jgi:hypothetical protein